jgi:hypothetical protein
MKNRSRTLPVVFFINVLVLSLLACNMLMSIPANTNPPCACPSECNLSTVDEPAGDPGSAGAE